MVSLIDFLQFLLFEVVESLDFEILFVGCKVWFIELYLFEQCEVVVGVLQFEFELLIKVLQENVYCELVLCQCINEVVQVVMFVYVKGNDLEQVVVFF